MRDTLSLEVSGIPTVTLIADSFFELARYTSSSLGMPDQRFVIVPGPMGGISTIELKDKIEAAFDDISRALTEAKPTKVHTNSSPRPHAKDIKIVGSLSDVQEFFSKNGLCAGLPFIPPTKHLVAEMLSGTTHSVDEIVWDGIPPRMGIATIELVAACAVMAGCKPEHMPLILATIEALKEPRLNYLHQATTTGTESLMLLVNGPAVKEIGLACDIGAAGLWYRANASIGYAVGLMAKIIGGARPPHQDKSTFSSPADLLNFVFGENEARSPWASFAVDHGFKATDSVVTAKVVYQPLDINDPTSNTGEELLNYTSHSINLPYLECMRDAPVVLGLCPEHASTLATDGFDKVSIQEYLWEHARYPSSAHAKASWETGKCKPNSRFPTLSYTSPTLVPIVARPEDIEIIVCGGAGKHSQFWPGPKPMVSKLVEPWK